MDSIVIERVRIPRLQAEKFKLEPGDMVVKREDVPMLRQKLDTLKYIEQQKNEILRQNDVLYQKVDTLYDMLKAAEAYAIKIDDKRQYLQGEILHNDLLVIRTEQDVKQLRRSILKTLRQNPVIKRKYLLFSDNVDKKTRLFGFSIMTIIFLLLTVPLTLALLDK